MTATVDLEGVTRTFGKVKAVEDLELRLEPGCIYGLLGPNGAGKSTTTKLIMGLLLPDRGRVHLLGRPPDDPGRNRIGYVPEQRTLPESARAGELLTLFGMLRGESWSQARAETKRWLERLHLQDKASARVDTLSNGQQQSVQIALALMGSPDLLLLDEPLTALDPVHQTLVLEHVRSAANQGTTVLVATHRLWEAEAFVDHVLLMDRGTKRLDASLHETLVGHAGLRWEIQSDSRGWIEGPGVVEVRAQANGSFQVQLESESAVPALLARGVAAEAQLTSFAPIRAKLQDVYLDIVRST